jgi:hypothetical protein
MTIDYNRHGKGQKLKSHCLVHYIYISCWQSGQRRDPNNALLCPSSLGSLLFEGLYRACHLPYFCSWFKTSATLANCNYKVRILYVYLVYFLNVNSKLLFFPATMILMILNGIAYVSNTSPKSVAWWQKAWDLHSRSRVRVRACTSCKSLGQPGFYSLIWAHKMRFPEGGVSSNPKKKSIYQIHTNISIN